MLIIILGDFNAAVRVQQSGLTPCRNEFLSRAETANWEMGCISVQGSPLMLLMSFPDWVLKQWWTIVLLCETFWLLPIVYISMVPNDQNFKLPSFRFQKNQMGKCKYFYIYSMSNRNWPTKLSTTFWLSFILIA